MIGAPPAQDEQARLSGARGEFVASLPRRLEVLRAALRAVEDQPRDPGRINGLLRRLHALGSAARVLGFASVAEALGETEKTLKRLARSGPVATELADLGRALDLLPSLISGAKVSIRAIQPPESAAGASHTFPLSVLVCAPSALADMLRPYFELRVECEPTEDPVKARELSRAFGPDVVVIDGDRKGARELIELFTKDPLVEPIPIVVLGDSATPELASSFSSLGATRVLPKPISPDQLRRTLLELREHGKPTALAREPLGELTVNQLVERIAVEIRRGLVEAVEPASRTSSVGFGEGTDVMSAVWGTVARLRELVTLRSDGNVRFEQTGPEGAVPLAPWNDERRVGERGAREGRASEGVALQGRRVVVADDDPAVVWFLSGILKAVGAEVFEAHDGERAFELTASLWPDLVVSDILMPKLDGFSLCHDIKRDVAVRDVPVILLSWKEDLLQRVRELGGDADGYLRKEAAASTVVERLREVLRPRARVEARVASGGEVRGRLDGLTPRLVLELACRAGRDVRVSIRDSSYLYELQVRAGAPRTAIRSANDGSFERGESVLSMLLGVSAGRFVIEPDSTACRAELSGSLYEQLAAPVARARAAQRSLSAGALTNVTRVAFDAARVGGYLECTPEPAQGLLRELLTGASPRDLLTSGRAPARLLEAVLSDFARRGAVLLVETAGGIEDISQTRVPPPAALTLGEIPQIQAEPAAAELQTAPATTAAAVADPSPAVPTVAAPEPEAAPPVSQRRPPAIYSQPPDPELASADEGWFSFQIESSAQPPEATAPPAAAEPAEAKPPLARADDPLRKTMTSTAPPRADDDAEPGASVPVQRGHRPEYRAETLGSAGNEAAAAQAAVAQGVTAAAAPAVVEPTPLGPMGAPPRPVAKPSQSEPPLGADAADDDPLAQALLVETPPPLGVTVRLDMPSPFSATAPLGAASPFSATAPLGATLPLSATAPLPIVTLPVAAKPADPAPISPPAALGPTQPLAATQLSATSPAPEKREDKKRSDTSTQPPTAVSRAARSKAPLKAPVKAAAKPAAASEGGGWLRTAVFSVLAAGASYYGITLLNGALFNPPAAPPASTTEAPGEVPAPVVHALPASAAAVAAVAPKTRLTTTDSALPPGTDVPLGNGLLEIQVPDGTAIRVDGEYLGMGPGRRVPLAPGAHQLTLGSDAPQSVLVKAGQRTLAVAASAPVSAPAPVGSP